VTDFGWIRRRRLVIIATSKFASDRYRSLEDVVPKEVSHITTWLTDKRLDARGFTHEYAELADNPSRREIQANLMETSGDDEWNKADAAVLYITGHGVVRDDGERRRHFLVLSETGRNLSKTALPTAELLDWLADTTIEYLLVVIDVCSAGQVVEEIMGRVKEHWLILPSSLEDQAAKPGALTEAIARYLQKAAQFNTHSRYLTVGLFVDTVNQMLEMIAPGQRVEEVYKGRRRGKPREPGSAHDPHVCLPNPAYEPQDELVQTEPVRQFLALPVKLLEIHNRVKGRWPSADSPGWLFTGRERLMRDLQEAAKEPGITMVTGRAGCGKSTELSRLVTLSDPEFRRRQRQQLRGVPTDLLPPRGAVDVAVSARGRSVRHVLTQICYDLGALGEVSSLDDTVEANRRALSRYVANKNAVTIVVDALDEAEDPAGLVTGVLGPLSEEHPERLRLLVGVRSPGEAGGAREVAELGEDSLLNQLTALGARRIAVDDDRRWNQDDLTTFVANILTNTKDSPYKNADRETVASIAEVISGLARRSYLMAQVAAETLTAFGAVISPDDPAWLADLEKGLVGAFRRDLRASLRTPDKLRWGVTLLRAAAFARGNGLPRYLVWPELATAIDAVDGAGYRYGDGDVRDLLKSRLSAYLVTDESDHLTVYRLIHNELRDILRYRWRELTEEDHEARPSAGEDGVQAVEAAIARRLRGDAVHRATVAVGQPVPSYIRRHLAEHAVAGDVLDECLPVPFLPYIDLSRLRAAIGASPARRQLDETVPWLPVVQQVTHLWEWDRPARNATAIEMWAVMDEIGLPGSGREPGPAGGPWRVNWAVRPPDMGNLLGRHKDTVQAAATAELSEGPIAVTGGLDGLLHVWDLSTGAHYRDREPIATTADSRQADAADDRRAIASVATARLRSGRTVAVTGSADGFIRVWDLATWQALGSHLGDGTEKIVAVATAVLPDGRVVVSAADALGTVRTWDLDSRQPVGVALHCGPGMALGLSTALVGGKLLGLATGEDSGLQVWDLVTGAPVDDRLTGHPLAVEEPGTGTLQGGRAVAAAVLDGEDIAVTGNGDGLLLWDLRKRAPANRRLGGGDGTIRTLAIMSAGDLVMAVTGGNRAVQVWDLVAGEPVGELLAGHEGSVEAVALGGVSGNSAFAVSVSRDATVRLWDVPGAALTPRRQSREIGIVESVAAVAPQHGSAIVITCSDTAQVWDLERGGDPVALTAYDSPVVSVAAAELPDGVLVVGGHWDGSISTWRADGTLVKRGEIGDIGAAASLATAMPDGRLVAVAGDWDGDVHVWDPLTATRIGEPLGGHADVVVALATVTILHGRTLVVSGSRDGTVQIRDLSAHVNPRNLAPSEPVTVPIGSEVASLTVTELADGERCVVVGGEDGKVHLFGLLDGAPVKAWKASDAAVAAVAAGRLPDGRVAVFTGGEGALVQAWDASTAEPIVEALPVPGPVLALAFEAGTSSLVVGGTGVAVACPRLGN